MYRILGTLISLAVLAASLAVAVVYSHSKRIPLWLSCTGLVASILLLASRLAVGTSVFRPVIAGVAEIALWLYVVVAGRIIERRRVGMGEEDSLE